jgi:hypothetical protein
MASPRLGSFFSENRTLAGFEACALSRSAFFNGLLGGSGTPFGALAALQDIATEIAKITMPRYTVIFATVSSLNEGDQTYFLPLELHGFLSRVCILFHIRHYNAFVAPNYWGSSLRISLRNFAEFFWAAPPQKLSRRRPTGRLPLLSFSRRLLLH